MTFTARYEGRCPGCEDRIYPGQAVDYDDDGDVRHELCIDAYPTFRRERVFDTFPDLTPGDTCPECFTIRSVNGACQCPN